MNLVKHLITTRDFHLKTAILIAMPRKTFLNSTVKSEMVNSSLMRHSSWRLRILTPVMMIAATLPITLLMKKKCKLTITLR